MGCFGRRSITKEDPRSGESTMGVVNRLIQRLNAPAEATTAVDIPQSPVYGIQELWRPKDCEPEVDIVAVHGLNGHAVKTWTAKSNRACWLKDFLPQYIPNARILTWGYNASIPSLTNKLASKERIGQHAETLIAQLTADRQLEGASERPIIFLCHSLGGIIVKRALSYARTRTASKVCHEYRFFAATYGILFFGTPHLGSAKAGMLQFLQRAASIPLPSRRSMKSSLVNALEYESEALQDITDYFVPIMKHFRVYFFWEAEKTDLKVMPKDYIVRSESAAPMYDDVERAGIAANHCDMVKFESVDDDGFLQVIDALTRYCEGATRSIQGKLLLASEHLAIERRRDLAMMQIFVAEAEKELSDRESAMQEIQPAPPHYETLRSLPWEEKSMFGFTSQQDDRELTLPIRAIAVSQNT